MSQSPARDSRFRRMYSAYYQKMFLDGVCFYCGMPANTMDHAVPISFFRALYDIVRPLQKRPLVPACSECNSLAGNRMFVSLSAKRRYIQTKLRMRYKKYLHMPEWEDYEFEKLGYMMNAYVRGSQEKKYQLMRRIVWPDAPNNLEQIVLILFQKEKKREFYEAKPANKKRDEYERSLSVRLRELDNKYAGALSEMAADLNARRVWAFGGKDWNAVRLQRTLWRLGIYQKY